MLRPLSQGTAAGGGQARLTNRYEFTIMAEQTRRHLLKVTRLMLRRSTDGNRDADILLNTKGFRKAFEEEASEKISHTWRVRQPKFSRGECCS